MTESKLSISLMPTPPEGVELPDKPRATFVLSKGLYNQRREKVQAGVPGFLPRLPPGVPRTRLALAQ